MKVVATYAIKGGVGKTTAAVNLAALAAADGLRTVLWDLDPQGSATFLFRVRPRVRGGARGLVRGRRPLDEAVKGTDVIGLDLVPADFRYRTLDLELDAMRKPTRALRRLVEQLADEYDLVVLDCPPSVSLVSESVVHAADLLLVPLIPATMATRSLDQLVEFLDALGAGGHDGAAVRRPEVLAFLSMVDRRKRLHRSSPRPCRRSWTRSARWSSPHCRWWSGWRTSGPRSPCSPRGVRPPPPTPGCGPRSPAGSGSWRRDDRHGDGARRGRRAVAAGTPGRA